MKFILLTHSQELSKANNTGALARQILGEDVELIVWQRKLADKRLQALLASSKAALLFPESDAEVDNNNTTVQHLDLDICSALSEDKTIGLYDYYVILDATWQQARKMYRQSPYLKSANKAVLRNTEASSYRRRRNQVEGGLCTVECVIALLSLVDRDERLVKLKEAYRTFNLSTP